MFERKRKSQESGSFIGEKCMLFIRTKIIGKLLRPRFDQQFKKRNHSLNPIIQMEEFKRRKMNITLMVQLFHYIHFF